MLHTSKYIGNGFAGSDAESAFEPDAAATLIEAAQLYHTGLAALPQSTPRGGNDMVILTNAP